MDFISLFGAGSSNYNFEDKLFKIRINNNDDNICDLTRGFFYIPNSKQVMAISYDNFQKYIKIKNFVLSKTENYQKFAKPPCQITHLLVVSIK